MKRHIALFVASGCYVGLVPGPRGTYGSIATTLVFFLWSRTYPQAVPQLHLSIVGLVTVIGVLAAAEVSRNTGHEDPSLVVIDEVAGQLVTFLFLPPEGWILVLGMFLFRLFDIWKPFPIRRLEALKNGVGIVADDLLAGVYANVLLQAAYWLIHR